MRIGVRDVDGGFVICFDAMICDFAQSRRKWQPLCGNYFVLWWSGTPSLGRGWVARSSPVHTVLVPLRLLLLREQGMADGFQLFPFGLVHFWEGKMEFVERLDNRGRHDQSRKPLVVRGNHEPRRVLRGRILDHLLVRFLVILPESSFVDVRHGELPVLFRILQALEEPFLLLFF